MVFFKRDGLKPYDGCSSGLVILRSQQGLKYIAKVELSDNKFIVILARWGWT